MEDQPHRQQQLMPSSSSSPASSSFSTPPPRSSSSSSSSRRGRWSGTARRVQLALKDAASPLSRRGVVEFGTTTTSTTSSERHHHNDAAAAAAMMDRGKKNRNNHEPPVRRGAAATVTTTDNIDEALRSLYDGGGGGVGLFGGRRSSSSSSSYVPPPPRADWLLDGLLTAVVSSEQDQQEEEKAQQQQHQQQQQQLWQEWHADPLIELESYLRRREEERQEAERQQQEEQHSNSNHLDWNAFPNGAAPPGETFIEKNPVATATAGSEQAPTTTEPLAVTAEIENRNNSDDDDDDDYFGDFQCAAAADDDDRDDEANPATFDNDDDQAASATIADEQVTAGVEVFGTEDDGDRAKDGANKDRDDGEGAFGDFAPWDDNRPNDREPHEATSTTAALDESLALSEIDSHYHDDDDDENPDDDRSHNNDPSDSDTGSESVTAVNESSTNAKYAAASRGNTTAAAEPNRLEGDDDDDDYATENDLTRHADEMLRRWNCDGASEKDDGMDDDCSNDAAGNADGISPASMDTPELLRASDRLLQQCSASDRPSGGFPPILVCGSGAAAVATNTKTPTFVSFGREKEKLEFAEDDDDEGPNVSRNPVSPSRSNSSNNTNDDCDNEEKKFDPLLGNPLVARDAQEKASAEHHEPKSGNRDLSAAHMRRLSAPSPDTMTIYDVSPAHHRRLSAPGILSGDEEEDPLWVRLPLEDLSTLEARFTRRRQQFYELEHRASSHPPVPNTRNLAQDFGLPEYFFTNPDLDDTAKFLESLPWHYVLPPTGRGPSSSKQQRSSCKDDDFDPTEYLGLWDDHTTNRLCDLDAAMERLQSDLLRRIQRHKAGLARANELIHEWEKNLRLAFMYCDRAQESFEHANGQPSDASGLAGQRALLETWRQKEEYADLNAILVELDSIRVKEQDLLLRIDLFDIRNANALEEYYAVMASAKEVEAIITNERLGRLQCLDEMRSRLSTIGARFWDRMLALARSLASRCCRGREKRAGSFVQTEYERLVQAVLDFHSNASVSGEPSIEDDLPSRWTQNLLRALKFEAERAFAVALLEPTDVEDSEFEQELGELAREADLHRGDTAKLRTLAHNLVTIRFVFESERYYLPKVFHRLCQLLVEVLHAHFLFHECHRKLSGGGTEDRCSLQNKHSDHLLSISSKMDSSLQSFWDHCEGVVARCLDEYLHFAPKRVLFNRSDNGMENSMWKNDLRNLEEVLLLTDRFVSVRYSFLRVEFPAAAQLAALHDGSHVFLCDKLADIFRRHLRSVHVEAMNSVGRRLANESWVLGTFQQQDRNARIDAKSSMESLLFGAVEKSMSDLSNEESPKRYIGLQESQLRLSISQLAENGNPFDVCTVTDPPEPTSQKRQPCNGLKLSESTVYESLHTFLADSNGIQQLAPETVTHELLAWFSRLLITINRLPLIVQDASAVFANLCDLYITTVFRLCAGNGTSERLLLGEKEQEPLPIPQHGFPPLHTSDENVADVSGFFSFRKGKRQNSGMSVHQRPGADLPSNLEAEICSPLLRDAQKVSALQGYILKAQESLRDVVSLDMVDNWLEDPDLDSLEEHACEAARLLGKREAAVWSCLVVAALVDAVSSVATSQHEAFSTQTFELDADLGPLKAYCKTVLAVVPNLTRVARTIACNRAVGGAEVVEEIIRVESGWEESMLHEHCNDYVEDLCDRCALTWGYLAVSAKLPPAALKITWENIVSSSYMSLLEGFSRVPACSTEGRALMALDLASFTSGISRASVSERLETVELVIKPPQIQPVFNMRYVDTYIKVFYYPKDDVMNWISENYLNYKLNHALALAIAAATGNEEQCSATTLRDLVEQVKMLYTEPPAK